MGNWGPMELPIFVYWHPSTAGSPLESVSAVLVFNLYWFVSGTDESST